MSTLFFPRRSVSDATKTEAMPSTRRGKGGDAAAATAAGGSNGVAALAGQARPSRVSASVALESFNWTDDAIVEVSRRGSFVSVGRSPSVLPGWLPRILMECTNICNPSVAFQEQSVSWGRVTRKPYALGQNDHLNITIVSWLSVEPRLVHRGHHPDRFARHEQTRPAERCGRKPSTLPTRTTLPLSYRWRAILAMTPSPCTPTPFREKNRQAIAKAVQGKRAGVGVVAGLEGGVGAVVEGGIGGRAERRRRTGEVSGTRAGCDSLMGSSTSQCYLFA